MGYAWNCSLDGDCSGRLNLAGEPNDDTETRDRKNIEHPRLAIPKDANPQIKPSEQRSDSHFPFLAFRFRLSLATCFCASTSSGFACFHAASLAKPSAFFAPRSA